MQKITKGIISKISFNQHQLAYYSQGEGETLVFLHGWPTNSRLWDSQVESLSVNYKSEVILNTILEPLFEAKKNEFLVLADTFKKLTMDRFLIIAKGDPLCYKHIQQLSDNNPIVPAYYIENCGHSIPLDRPHELNEILINILTVYS